MTCVHRFTKLSAHVIWLSLILMDFVLVFRGQSTTCKGFGFWPSLPTTIQNVIVCQLFVICNKRMSNCCRPSALPNFVYDWWGGSALDKHGIVFLICYMPDIWMQKWSIVRETEHVSDYFILWTRIVHPCRSDPHRCCERIDGRSCVKMGRNNVRVVTEKCTKFVISDTIVRSQTRDEVSTRSTPTWSFFFGRSFIEFITTFDVVSKGHTHLIWCCPMKFVPSFNIKDEASIRIIREKKLQRRSGNYTNLSSQWLRHGSNTVIQSKRHVSIDLVVFWRYVVTTKGEEIVSLTWIFHSSSLSICWSSSDLLLTGEDDSYFWQSIQGFSDACGSSVIIIERLRFRVHEFQRPIRETDVFSAHSVTLKTGSSSSVAHADTERTCIVWDHHKIYVRVGVTWDVRTLMMLKLNLRTLFCTSIIMPPRVTLHLHTISVNGKVQVHQNHFHQKKFSSKSTFIKNHLHQKPLSPKTNFIKKPLSSKCHFHQKPLSSKTTFIKNHFHQKPLSSEHFLSEGPITRAKTKKSVFVWKRRQPKARDAFTQTRLVLSRKARWGSKGGSLGKRVLVFRV